MHKYADPDTMFRGEIGKLGNIRFIETSEAKIWKDSTCPDGLAVFGTLVLGAHPAEPARFRGLEGHACGRASGGAVHGAH
ncbi:Uncharacterised protein [uncultured Clostridium sp.]|nr:Uncharacterised protein [uncultured Clostridium sp.]